MPFAVPKVNCVFPPPVCSLCIYDEYDASFVNHILTFPLLFPSNPPLNIISVVDAAVFAPLTYNLASGNAISVLLSTLDSVIVPTNKLPFAEITNLGADTVVNIMSLVAKFLYIWVLLSSPKSKIAPMPPILTREDICKYLS